MQVPGNWKAGSIALVLAGMLLVGCTTPAEEARPDDGVAVVVEAPPPPPWTEAFQDEAMLVADEVRIEGPPGLREHLAVSQSAEHHLYVIDTTPAGLLQETSVRPAFLGEVSLRGKMDGLTLVVAKRVVVLERPSYVPVTISAFGDVYWRNSVTGEERRGESLNLRGEAPR